MYLFEAYVLKTFFIKISIAIKIRIFLSEIFTKQQCQPFLEELTNARGVMGTFGIDWAITHNKASIGEVFLKKT